MDFDLRRMHDLGCNFGMGTMDMFYANVPQPRGTPEQRDAEVDRFLAATVAFGHPGFLVFDGGMGHALRSYYMLQQLHSRYCLTNVGEIRYAAADGSLLDTSQAVARGLHARSQVVTRYADGTVTAANGSRTERLRARVFGRDLDLPPNGYAGWTADGAIAVLSSDPGGHRGDYAVTPAHLYVDGRGRFLRFDQAAGNGIGICRRLGGGTNEIILYQDAECGFALERSRAMALNKQGDTLGPAELRTARGLTYVVPVKGAFSYRLTRDAGADGANLPALSCPRADVVPGERVVVRGRQAHEVEIPSDAKAGQRLWRQLEGAWIDFTVVPLAEAGVGLEENTLRVVLSSHLPRPEDFDLSLILPPSASGQGAKPAFSQRVRLEPGVPAAVTVDLGGPREEQADLLALELRAGELRQRVERGLRVTSGLAAVAPFPAIQTRGLCLRGGGETAILGETGALANQQTLRCGEVEKSGLFMHPPYKTGVGYTYATLEPLPLPAGRPGAFRAWVGKQDGSDPGDGILFKLALLDEADHETLLAQTNVLRHEWLPLEADLSRWAGQRVRLKLIADVGAKNDSSGDWACWAGMRVETLRPVLVRSLDPASEKYRREPGPWPVPGLRHGDLSAARQGWLRYDAKGLEGHGPYATVAVLNGIELGEMSPGFGDETKGVFAEKVGVPLTAAALRALGACNRFVLRNPKGDSFSIRQFWIELDLADGRRCSSEVTPLTLSQPPQWPYAQGERVPFGQDISVDICFRLGP